MLVREIIFLHIKVELMRVVSNYTDYVAYDMNACLDMGTLRVRLSHSVLIK